MTFLYTNIGSTYAVRRKNDLLLRFADFWCGRRLAQELAGSMAERVGPSWSFWRCPGSHGWFVKHR